MSDITTRISPSLILTARTQANIPALTGKGGIRALEFTLNELPIEPAAALALLLMREADKRIG